MAVRITRAGVALTVGIIILTGLLIGGLLWVRHSGEQARRAEAVKIAEQQLQEQSNQDVSLNDGESSSNGAGEGASNGSNEATNSQEGATSDESTTNGSTNEQANGSSSSDAQDMPTTGTTEGAVETADELPQTGPADAAPFIALGLLTFAGLSYYQSRRVLLEL